MWQLTQSMGTYLTLFFMVHMNQLTGLLKLEILMKVKSFFNRSYTWNKRLWFSWLRIIKASWMQRHFYTRQIFFIGMNGTEFFIKYKCWLTVMKSQITSYHKTLITCLSKSKVILTLPKLSHNSETPMVFWITADVEQSHTVSKFINRVSFSLCLNPFLFWVVTPLYSMEHLLRATSVFIKSMWL